MYTREGRDRGRAREWGEFGRVVESGALGLGAADESCGDFLSFLLGELDVLFHLPLGAVDAFGMRVQVGVLVLVAHGGGNRRDSVSNGMSWVEKRNSGGKGSDRREMVLFVCFYEEREREEKRRED